MMIAAIRHIEIGFFCEYDDTAVKKVFTEKNMVKKKIKIES